MTSRRAKFRKHMISCFGWLGAIMLFLLAYWWVMSNYLVRDFWDPQYVIKSEVLRSLVKKNPGHPLWLMMGTSHVDFGVRPGVLQGDAHSPHDANAPLIFNFGFTGADMYRQYSCLKRLLESGVRPQRVGLEIFEALMSRKTETFADNPDLLVRARRDELGALCAFAADPSTTRAAWQRSRWDPFYKYGMSMPNQTLTMRLFLLPAFRRMEPHIYDIWGWFAIPSGDRIAARYQQDLNLSKTAYAGDFASPYAIAPHNDQLLRMTLDMCRKAGIDVFLFKMPEHADFLAIYTPEANTVTDHYLAGIAREYGIRVIDARAWIPDRDEYTDGHHLNGTGAKNFTLLFAQALLQTPQAPAH